MLFADFESIFKPVYKQYSETLNQIKTEKEGRTLYTEKINTNVPSGCEYTARLHMEIFLIHLRCTVVKIV